MLVLGGAMSVMLKHRMRLHGVRGARSWQLGLLAYGLSIPIFSDITIVMMAPLNDALPTRERALVLAAASLSHSLVPPTPGVLATGVMLHAPVHLVTLVGFGASFLPLVAITLVLQSMRHKRKLKRQQRGLPISPSMQLSQLIPASARMQLLFPVAIMLLLGILGQPSELAFALGVVLTAAFASHEIPPGKVIVKQALHLSAYPLAVAVAGSAFGRGLDTKSWIGTLGDPGKDPTLLMLQGFF